MQGDCKSGQQADELRRIRVDGGGDELLVRGQEGKTRRRACANSAASSSAPTGASSTC